jgi:hypothetical protein
LAAGSVNGRRRAIADDGECARTREGKYNE